MAAQWVVRTPAEFAQALAAQAQKITVEGDASLLDLAKHTVLAPTPPPLPQADLPAKRTPVLLISAVVIGVLIAVVSLWFAFSVELGSPQLPLPSATPLSASNTSLRDLLPWGWLVFAVLVAILLYRIIMRALAGDRNVQLSWKITDQVEGKLVMERIPVSATSALRP